MVSSLHGRACDGDARCCIVPDFLLEQIATNLATAPPSRAKQEAAATRSRKQRAATRAAISTLTADGTLRAQRSARLEARRRMFELARELQPRAALRALGATAPRVRRVVYDAEHLERLPGTRVRGPRDAPSQDVAVNEAFDGAGATLDFYFEAYSRNSIDGLGMPVYSSVHYSRNYDNAFWNGSQMVYGDGDGQFFNRLTVDIDVIGHELTHGVTEREAGLTYSNQPGALNESISDVFGSLVKQFAGNQTADQATWLIGEHIFTDAVQPHPGAALRSLKAPGTAYDDPVLGKDPQTADMSDYVRTNLDNGGVHINSGIPNHAFYLAATAIGGYAWERAGLIWYTTLRSRYMRPRIRFTGFARLSCGVARGLFGPGSAELRAVRDAWRAVGVL
jgi:Zn-dependent metalloprotease